MAQDRHEGSGVGASARAATAGRVAARRRSAMGVAAAGSRHRSKSAPGGTSAELRVHPVRSESRFEMAAPATGSAAQVRPLVSTTQAPPGSATRNEDQ
ncbi:MAG: hypothetical protein M5U14_04525 [Acidimicrobiia bacterium]|nr:hypothetical protein [Acidimicrobiia bacterium]